MHEARLGPGVDAREVRELIEQVHRLRQGLRGRRQAELRGWLDSLATQLEEVRVAETASALSYR
jgi:hypothetical protein